METAISILYYLMTAAIAAVLIVNFLRARDAQRMILYAVVLMPFIMRLLRLK